MRKGYSPSIALTRKGDILAIATGSDATAEHEGGSDPLLTFLTGHAPARKADIGLALRTGKLTTVPNILDTRYIRQNLDRVVFEVGVERDPAGNSVPVAAIGAHDHQWALNLLQERELRFSNFGATDCAGAWDSASFGFKVRGEKQVRMLERFHEAIRAGDAMFAGLFLTGNGDFRLNGVVICNTQHLRAEHRAAMKKAQEAFDLDCQLHALSRADEIQEKARSVFSRSSWSFGHIWPVWDRTQPGKVAYAYNPGYGVKASYYGPYSFDELMRWLDAGASESLRPCNKVAAL